ncbi:MAG: ABC transporter substrate-binding protein, partial [Planctomycetota bacterium]
KKLRRAFSIALDIEEYIQIFRNGRGIPAQGPIPPGIAGYQEGKDGINPFVYEWDEKAGKPRRKSIEEARRLLAEAGYPNGRDAGGKALVVYLDTAATGPEAKATLDWLRKQLVKIGVQLQIRATDYNRFQDKVLKGNCQILFWGWNADYPDPENFLFLLYGPNSKVVSQGENACNYDSPKFNALFKEVENMPNSPERLAKIREMLGIYREDAPWIGGFHSIGYALIHDWYLNVKPMGIGENTLKYKRINPDLRARRRKEWNEPNTTPVWIALALLVASAIPASIGIYLRERRPPS